MDLAELWRDLRIIFMNMTRPAMRASGELWRRLRRRWNWGSIILIPPLVLATKASFGDRDAVMRSVEASLKNLKRDYVDLLQIHGDSISRERWSRIAGPGGMLEAMRELKQSGMVKHLGFTTEDNNDVVYEMMDCGEFDVVQMCYNFLFQHPYEPSRPFGSMMKARELGMGIATMRAPTSGTFQR